jgi:hypothetical protein
MIGAIVHPSFIGELVCEFLAHDDKNVTIDAALLLGYVFEDTIIDYRLNQWTFPQ